MNTVGQLASEALLKFLSTSPCNIRKSPAGHPFLPTYRGIDWPPTSQLFPDAHGGFALLCIFNIMYQETDRETTKA